VAGRAVCDPRHAELSGSVHRPATQARTEKEGTQIPDT
jgi:hypothetical protein